MAVRYKWDEMNLKLSLRMGILSVCQCEWKYRINRAGFLEGYSV